MQAQTVVAVESILRRDFAQLPNGFAVDRGFGSRFRADGRAI